MNPSTRREPRVAPRAAWRWLVIALLVPIGLTIVLLWLDAENRRGESLRQDVVASWERRIDLVALLSLIKDAETAQRGYLLSDDPAFLAPYAPARAAVTQALVAPRYASSTPASRARRNGIAELAAMKFDEMDRTIAAQRQGDRLDAARQVAGGRGKALMDRIRILVAAEIDAEAAATIARRDAAEAQRVRLRVIVLVILSLICAAIIGGIYLLWRSWHERQAALVEADESARRRAAILNSTIDPILILNPSGTIETINAAASRLLGYTDAELERRDIAMLMDIAPGDGSFHHRIGLRDGVLDRAYRTDCIVRARDGSAIPVDVAMGVMRVPSGDHIVLSLRDITERKRVEQIKDELISTVSHELRTPLTSIVGALGLIGAGAAGSLPEAAARLIAIADSNARRLIRVINDMLDIDRIESGKLALHREPIDLRAVAQRAAGDAAEAARSGGTTITLDLPAHPVVVSGDADRLAQVATNLLSNAIRVAPPGTPVRLRVAQSGDAHAILTVADRGPGIPMAFRTRIFGRFERAEAQEGSTGTGLGLAISREIATMHGGTLDYADRDGGGTRFRLSLPLLGAAAQTRPDAARVLICEQDERVAARLAALVVAEGCACDIVATSAAARTALAGRAYAALLIDLNLPTEGGLALAHALRDGEPPVTVPMIVVAVTGPGEGEGADLQAIDVIDWIAKPVDGDRLGIALRAALARGDARHPSVLHLDDDQDLLDVVALTLQPEVRIVKVKDLASARALIAVSPPDVAIIDVQLAQESGLELLPELLDREGRPIPTILYTAQEVPAEIAAQVDAVLVKARGSLPDLKATLRRILKAGPP